MIILKQMLRIMATTVARDIPAKVVEPMVMLAVDTPIPRTIAVSIRLIGWIVVNFAIYQNTDTGSGNNAEEQHGYTAHYRYRNTLNGSGQLAEAGQNNGKDCCATDNPGGEYLGNRQYTDVLAISGIRGGAEEARQDGGDTVTDDGAVKSRILGKVSTYNVTGYKQMAYMFGDNHQSCPEGQW